MIQRWTFHKWGGKMEISNNLITSRNPKPLSVDADLRLWRATWRSTTSSSLWFPQIIINWFSGDKLDGHWQKRVCREVMTQVYGRLHSSLFFLSFTSQPSSSSFGRWFHERIRNQPPSQYSPNKCYCKLPQLSRSPLSFEMVVRHGRGWIKNQGVISRIHWSAHSL